MRESAGPGPGAKRGDSRQVLDLIAGRWTPRIIAALARGPLRHGELRRSIDGISQKMLTQTLRALERDGLVARRAFPTIPPRVEYALTPLGATLKGPLCALCRWAELHRDEVLAARVAHDAGKSPGP